MKNMPDQTRKQAPELLAAGATIRLNKLETEIASAKKKLAEKESEHAAILKGLTPEVKTLVDRLRGKST